MSDEQWYALESGQQRGPFSRAELVNRLADGAPVALVWRDGMTGWVPPQDVAELAGREDDAPQQPAFEQAFRAVAHAYGATVETIGRTHRFETTQADLTVRVSCNVGFGTHSMLEIERRGVPYPELTIRPEDELDRAGKRLRIDREAQIGDEALDRQVYFETALPPREVRGLVGRPGFRHALDRWLERGARRVRLDGDGLAVLLPVKRADALTPALVAAELAAVAEAADGLRGLDPALARHRRAVWPRWILISAILGALAGVPAALGAHALWEPVGSMPVVLGLGGGVVLAGAILAVMILLLRGQSGAFRDIVGAAVPLLVALPALGTAGLLVANGAFDRRPEALLETVVKNKTEEQEKPFHQYFVKRPKRRTRHYLLTVEGTRVRKVPVADRFWHDTPIGAPLRVRVRQGALGWEWDAGPK